MYPNIRAVVKAGEREINAKVDKSIVGKHKGDNGGTFGVEGGVRESTQKRLRCFLLTFSFQKRQGK
jgi:hypothetical protein